MRGIHRSPVNSPQKGQRRGALMFFYLRPNKCFSIQWRRWWFEAQSGSLWRHCNDEGEYYELIAGQIQGHGLRSTCVDAVLSFYFKPSYNGYFYTMLNSLWSKTVIVLHLSLCRAQYFDQGWFGAKSWWENANACSDVTLNLRRRIRITFLIRFLVSRLQHTTCQWWDIRSLLWETGRNNVIKGSA